MFIKIINVLIDFFAFALNPNRAHVCRFQPSCSNYAKETFSEHEWYRAVGLTLRRLSRCQPWGSHGYDPVPEHKD